MLLIAALFLAQAPACQDLPELTLVPRREWDQFELRRSGPDEWTGKLDSHPVTLRRQPESGRITLDFDSLRDLALQPMGLTGYQTTLMLGTAPLGIRVFRAALAPSVATVRVQYNSVAEPKSTCAIDFREGAVWPDFTFEDSQRKQRRFSTTRYTLINYWASWCVPCRHAIPQLISLQKTKIVDVIGVNGDEDPRAMRGFLADYPMPWQQATKSNPMAMMNFRFQTPSYPIYVLLTPERRVVFLRKELTDIIPWIVDKLDKF